ncbi:MAG: DUF4870 domain-containing protein [Clostridiales bacterium]|nr:DUF4870 domain-containing protein [Clostridiales bacterium]
MNKTPTWLTYILGWVTGLIFLGTEKNDAEIRWHAANSTAVFGAATVVTVVLNILSRIPFLGVLFGIVGWLVGVVTFILWIVLMINAGNGSRFRVPFLTDFAEKNLLNLFK